MGEDYITYCKLTDRQTSKNGQRSVSHATLLWTNLLASPGYCVLFTSSVRFMEVKLTLRQTLRGGGTVDSIMMH